MSFARSARRVPVIALACFVVGEAVAKTFEIPDYDVTLTVTDQGNYRVRETIRYAYPEGRFTYGERTIPKAGIDSLELRGVESPDADIRDAALTDQGDHWRIRWAFPERREPARYTLRYTARGALDDADGRKVVDWDVVGSKWPVAIRDVHAVIRIPRAFADTEAALSLPDDAEIRRGAEAWRVVMGRDSLPPGERFRVRVGFPEAGTAAPSETETGWLAWLASGLRSVLGFALGFALMAVAPQVLARKRRKRAATAETRQPPDLSPEEAAVFLHKGEGGAWPAAIFRLAEAGALVLRHNRKDIGPIPRWIIHAEARTAPEHADTPFGAEVLAHCAHGPVKLDKLVKELRRNSAPRERTLAGLARMGLLEHQGAWLGQARQPVALLIVLIVLFPGVLEQLPLPPEIPVGALLLGGAIGMWSTGGSAYQETGLGLLTRRRLRELFERKRADVLAHGRAQPAAALARFLSELSWLTIDPKADAAWMKRFRNQVRGAAVGAATLPAWLVFDDTDALPTDAAELVDTMSQDLLPAAAHPAPGGPGGGAGGGGAGGGGGGGG